MKPVEIPEPLERVIQQECTGTDDHDPEPCDKCNRYRLEIAKAILQAKREEHRMTCKFKTGDCYRDDELRKQAAALGEEP